VGKGISNRNHGYSNALKKLRALGLIEVIENGEAILHWQVRLLVCPDALSKLLS
jgi:2-iminoacetate synthase ThiH